MKKVDMILIIIFILVLIVAIVAANVNAHEANVQEKINFELQVEYDKVLTENEYLRYKTEVLEEKNKELDEKLDRVLKISSSSAEQVKRVIMSETRGSSLLDAMGATQTVKDRSESWSMTAFEVVNKPNQYAKPYQGEINDKINLAFELVYLDGYRVFDEVTTHFHADYVNPYWAENKAFRGKVSRHLYYGPEV